MLNWFVVLFIAAIVAGLLGLAMQQLLLRWNQGQELRQALITIAVSVIVADQVVVHTGGGTAQDMSFPGSVNKFVDLRIDRLLLFRRAPLHPRRRHRDRHRALGLAQEDADRAW